MLESTNPWFKDVDNDRCVDVLNYDIAEAFDTVSNYKLLSVLDRKIIRGPF